MKFFLIIILSLLGFTSNAQQTYFNKRFDHDSSSFENGWSIFNDSNGIYITFGTLFNDGIGNHLVSALLQLDQNGNSIDTNFFSFPYVYTYAGGSGSLSKTSNGIAFGGSYVDSLQSDAMLVNLNYHGDTIWIKHFGDTTFQSGWMAKQCAGGGFLLCGQTLSTDTFGNALFLKTDSIGNVIWQKEYGYFGSEELAFAFTPVADGGYAIAARRRFPSSNSDFYIVKTDSDGNMQWDTTMGGPQFDELRSITSTLDGNFVVAGDYAYDLSQSHRPFIAKLDLSGNIMWEKQYDDTLLDYAIFSIRELKDSSFIFCGYKEILDSNFDGHQHGIIYKISNNGDSLWSNTYSIVTHNNWLTDIYPTTDGGFVACGTAFPSASDTGHEDIWILKIDSLGCEVSNCILGVGDILNNNFPVKIFPNPCTSEFNIELKDNYEESELHLYNMLGEEVKKYSLRGNRNLSIQTNDLPDGIFLLSVTKDGKQIFSQKINHLSN